MRHNSCVCWANICQGAVLLNICREVIFLMIGQPINLPWAEFVFVTVGRGQLMTERADISCNGRPDDTKHVSDDGGWRWGWHQVTTLWSIEAVITENFDFVYFSEEDGWLSWMVKHNVGSRDNTLISHLSHLTRWTQFDCRCFFYMRWHESWILSPYVNHWISEGKALQFRRLKV